MDSGLTNTEVDDINSARPTDLGHLQTAHSREERKGEAHGHNFRTDHSLHDLVHTHDIRATSRTAAASPSLLARVHVRMDVLQE
jgi:hypothetical protein